MVAQIVKSHYVGHLDMSDKFGQTKEPVEERCVSPFDSGFEFGEIHA